MSITIDKYISKRNNSEDIIYDVHNDACDVNNLFSNNFEFIASMENWIFKEYWNDLISVEIMNKEYMEIKDKLLHAYNNL